jgi:hypothetical protein
MKAALRLRCSSMLIRVRWFSELKLKRTVAQFNSKRWPSNLAAVIFVLAPASDLVDAAQQIGRILVDAERTGLPQLVRPIAAA